MITNPKTISWTAPTTNADGTPIDYTLDYELGTSIGDDPAITPLMSIVGALQPDGNYQAPLALAEHMDGVQYKAYLRAIDHDDAARVSVWSAPTDAIMFVSLPNPPTNFTVA